MLTGAPPTDHASASPSPRRRVWPWAAGSILITLAVLVATLAGQRLAARARLASQVSPAPTLPTLATQAIAHAPGLVTHLALDTQTHTLVAQIVACQPVAATKPQTAGAATCAVSANAAQSLAFFTSDTGALRGASPVSSASPAQPVALTDATHGITYLINNGSVTAYDDSTGKPTGSYTSPLLASAQDIALDGQLGLLFSANDSSALNALDAASGQLLASAPLPPPSAGGTLAPQVRVDASASRVYVYNGNPMAPILYAFNAGDLTPLGSWRLPGRPSLGPLDSMTHTLYLSGTGAIGVSQLNLTTLPADGAGEQVNVAQTILAAALGRASHFGVDSATGALVVTSATGTEAFAANAAQPYAQLPLVKAPVVTVNVSPWLLPVDASTGLAYLPGDDMTILIVSLARPTSFAAPNALTAALIAREGMTKLLPPPTQNPPFVTAQTFPLGAGSIARQYFQYYPDLGWKGPYAGMASISSVTAGAAPGDYTMTLTISWDQLFLRQHSWMVEVTPDGRTHVRSESGDGVP